MKTKSLPSGMPRMDKRLCPKTGQPTLGNLTAKGDYRCTKCGQSH